jgi:hypothetical protein
MVKKHMKSNDGLYHIKGDTYELLEGSRAQVWHKNAFKTPGGLTRSQLLKNKHGRIVSRKKHGTAKKEKRLVKAGYTAKKGKFGAVKIGKSEKRKRCANGSRRNKKTKKCHRKK